jgi:hypothetical protein
MIPRSALKPEKANFLMVKIHSGKGSIPSLNSSKLSSRATNSLQLQLTPFKPRPGIFKILPSILLG